MDGEGRVELASDDKGGQEVVRVVLMKVVKNVVIKVVMESTVSQQPVQ